MHLALPFGKLKNLVRNYVYNIRMPAEHTTGLDKDTGLEGLTEFDIEIRRRLWTLLYVWDWYVITI